DRVVYVSSALLKQLKLSGKKRIAIKLGKEIATAAVRPLKRQGKHLYLSTGLRSLMRVPKSGHVYVHNTGTDEVQIGPLIGVLTESVAASPSQPFGNRTSYIRQLLKIGEN